jgi:hypothetical protein
MKDLNAAISKLLCAWSRALPALWAWKWWAETMAKVSKRVAKKFVKALIRDEAL